MIIKIGYEHWHVECQCSNIVELEKNAKRAFLEHTKSHGVPANPMILATWSGREWWGVPPDHYNAQKYGDVSIRWPLERNDFGKIWDALCLSDDFGRQFNDLVGFVATETPEERRAKFKIVERKK